MEPTPVRQKYPKVGRISDPIHGYIEFTSLERHFLDYPVAQRLRNVAQSGLAHYVFPELRTSRFSHCLGTMDLASRMLSSCLRNATASVKEGLADAIRSVIANPRDGMTGIRHASNGDDKVLIAHVHDTPENHDLWIAVEQAVRLAALFHDLGHLPFSHDFEFALEDARDRIKESHPYLGALQQLTPLDTSRNLAPHELLGHGVARLLMRDLIIRCSEGKLKDLPQQETYVNQVCNLALIILRADESPDDKEKITLEQNAVLWLHSIISGEIDSDRGDFLLRDGRNYGFEFAAYNLDRMLDNLVVSQREPDGRWLTAIRPQGLSTIESYILSRYRSYQLGVRHHKVAQVGAALRYCIARLVVDHTTFSNIVDHLGEFFRALKVLSNPSSERGIGPLSEEESEALSTFARCDDIWWMTTLRSALQKLQDRQMDKGIDEIPQEKELMSWMSLVCWRSRGTKSLWKRTSDFLDLVPNDSELRGANPIALWNKLALDFDDPNNLSRFNDVRLKLEQQGVLLLRHKFKPWKVGSNGESEHLFMLRDDGTMEAVSGISAIVRALRPAWEEDIQLHAFATESWSGDGRLILSQLTRSLAEQARAEEESE